MFAAWVHHSGKAKQKQSGCASIQPEHPWTMFQTSNFVAAFFLFREQIGYRANCLKDLRLQGVVVHVVRQFEEVCAPQVRRSRQLGHPQVCKRLTQGNFNHARVDADHPQFVCLQRNCFEPINHWFNSPIYVCIYFNSNKNYHPLSGQSFLPRPTQSQYWADEFPSSALWSGWYPELNQLQWQY